MSFSLITYIIVSIVYIIVGINAYNANRTSKANQIFLGITATLALWAFLLALMSTTKNAEVAAIFRWIMIVCWSSLYVQILNFVLVTTGSVRHSSKLWFKIIILVPAIFNFFFYVFNRVPAEYMLRINGTWAFKLPMGWGLFYDHYFTAYYLLYMVASIILLVRHRRSAIYIRERKQARLIYISFIIVGIVSSFPDIILPQLGFVRIPPVTAVVSLLSVGSVWYAIKKYSLMNLSGDKLLLEVSQLVLVVPH